jgi:hypothetical protein
MALGSLTSHLMARTIEASFLGKQPEGVPSCLRALRANLFYHVNHKAKVDYPLAVERLLHQLPTKTTTSVPCTMRKQIISAARFNSAPPSTPAYSDRDNHAPCFTQGSFYHTWRAIDKTSSSISKSPIMYSSVIRLIAQNAFSCKPFVSLSSSSLK